MADPTPTEQSPCIRMCTLNEDNVCVGCWRSLDEIVGWEQMTTVERSVVLERAGRRSARQPYPGSQALSDDVGE